MELQDYLRILWKRGWIIILVAFITAASAYGFSKLQMPIYKGIQQIHFKPARADWGLQMSAKDQLPIYLAQLNSDEVAWKVINRLGLDLQPSALRAKIRVGSDQATFSLTVEALDPDPKIAKDIADAFARVFVEDQDEWNQRQDKRDRIYAYIRNDARYQLFSPRKKVNTLAGGIFGVLLGGLVVFFLEWLESDIVRTAEDVERYIGVPVLGTIPTMAGRTASAGRRRWLPTFKGLNPTKALIFGAGFLTGAAVASLVFTVL